MRDILDKSLKDAMRARDSQKISTIRLINAAIKDRDIAVRSEDNLEGVSDEEILSILSKMIKQRQESAKQYEEGGRLELAQQEFEEIKIIETFLPKQLNSEETEQIVHKIILEINATSLRDMGKVMNTLKEKYSGKMDFGKAGTFAKDALTK
ncbi:MAG: aspartyl-tRNA amidotransferase subunit B [Rhodobacterales bacterium]|nr:MAG: aspartyl-tRNA amidotransferase subunit B [Rhodobacterales bacterium]